MAPSPSAASSRPTTATRSTTRTSTAPPGSPPGPFPLARFAELVHEAAAPLGEPLVVRVDRPDGDDLAFGTWVVPPTVDHPADPLVGFVAPKAWDALGLVVTGRDHAADAEPDRRQLSLTVLTDRAGSWASVIERSEEERTVLASRPDGWVADLLDRALGRPTPPPAYAPSHVLEAEWLDAVAQVVLPSPGGRHRWSKLAALHPLAPPGPALPGTLLAVQAATLDAETTWSRLRERFRSDGNPPEHRVPGGATLALPRWFDDGSFSRWAERRRPEAELLLEGILDAVSADVGAELADALISVAVPPSAP